MDDARTVGVRQGVEHLRRDLDRLGVGEVVCSHDLAHRAAGHVLVGDVDVARVVADVVRAHAAIVAEPPGRERLTLGARRRLPFARDDLERDVEARPLVAREPDGARPAAAERANRPVAAEDELGGGRSERDGRHLHLFVGEPMVPPRVPSFCFAALSALREASRPAKPAFGPSVAHVPDAEPVRGRFSLR
jgi:hypothetical protein